MIFNIIHPTKSIKNIAKKKATLQSSVWFFENPVVPLISNFAVDGNLFQNLDKCRCCSHTLFEDNPWWLVDLGDVHNVTAVTLYNRVECCRKCK